MKEDRVQGSNEGTRAVWGSPIGESAIRDLADNRPEGSTWSAHVGSLGPSLGAIDGVTSARVDPMYLTLEERVSSTADRKNSWQSAEELRKYKDNNREKQNTAWKHQLDEPKCNIQKENKMMGAAGQPPIITHTAATPQDSPNTTLDVGYRDLNCRAVYPTAALSIESIDRSGSQCSIPSGLLKLPDVSNKIPTKNLIAGQFPRRISHVTAVVNPATRESSSSSPPRIQRGYSWKLSRPSLRRKRWSQTDEEPPGRATVLNNGRSTLLGSNSTILVFRDTRSQRKRGKAVKHAEGMQREIPMPNCSTLRPGCWKTVTGLPCSTTEQARF
ncbi:hypothetical protein WN48_11133 [Eufriesea mexicana]|nr:hypothetical protein WN48_11133 [Eufriesea mexicana]